MLYYGHGAGGWHYVGRSAAWIPEYNDSDMMPTNRKGKKRKKNNIMSSAKPKIGRTLDQNIILTKKYIKNRSKQLSECTDPMQREMLQKKISNLKITLTNFEKRKSSNTARKKKPKSRSCVKNEPVSSVTLRHQKEKLEVEKLTKNMHVSNTVSLYDTITIASAKDSTDKISRTLDYPLEKNPPAIRMFIDHRLGDKLKYNDEFWVLTKIQKSNGKSKEDTSFFSKKGRPPAAAAKISKPKTQPPKAKKKNHSVPKIYSNCLHFDMCYARCTISSVDCIGVENCKKYSH